MSTARRAPLIDPLPDYEPDALADHEAALPDIQHAALEWLTENNRNDQKVLFWMGSFLVAIGAAFSAWLVLVLGACLYLAIPARRLAGRYFDDGQLREGLLVTTLTTWSLQIPVVLFVPDALPIGVLNVVGPLILAATYFEHRLVRRLVPAGIGLAVALSFAALLLPGAGFDEQVPRWVYVPGLVGYLAVGVAVVLQDLQESNRVRLRLLRRAVETNDELETAGIALQESRRRLVAAADEERLRLERNLHDGAQQRLASLALRLRLTAELSQEGKQATADDLLALHAEAAAAIDELREFTSGIFPTRLTDLGLVGAVRSMARRVPLAVDITGDDVDALDDETALGIYFAISEVVQNSIKHAGDDAMVTIDFATTQQPECRVLVITIGDDGVGFAPGGPQHRRGLLNIEDRIAAVGGAVTLVAAPGAGTCYTIAVPLPEPSMEER